MHIRELAKKTGVSYYTLWTLYHEKTKGINFNTVEQICRTLGIQVGDLFEYVETEEKPKKEIKLKKR